MSPRVIVYTKPGCHLCQWAEETVSQVCADLDVDWQPHDISQDRQLMDTYGEQLPVTFVDGRQHDFWRVDPQRLRSALSM